MRPAHIDPYKWTKLSQKQRKQAIIEHEAGREVVAAAAESAQSEPHMTRKQRKQALAEYWQLQQKHAKGHVHITAPATVVTTDDGISRHNPTAPRCRSGTFHLTSLLPGL